jgi:hypothetical protein
MEVPDRNEFFWARADAHGKFQDKGNPGNETRLDYNELKLIQEVAVNFFSLVIELPYREFDADVNGHAANFGDMSIATKSLLLDCDLIQFSFQFKTFIPTGNATHGIGTGHASLEPSLLTAIHLFPDTYLQAQLAEWIPLGGDPDYEGAILHFHASLNHVLWRPSCNTQIIGTAEFNSWFFQTGRFTPAFGHPTAEAASAPLSSDSDPFLSAGPGIRAVFCDKADIGVAVALGFSGIPWPDTLIRSEFRYRY